MEEPKSVDLAGLPSLRGEQKRLKRRAMLIGAVLLVVLGGGGVALLRKIESDNTEKISGSWSAFSRCLLGEPLAAGEKPSLRFRNLQLSAMVLPEPQRSEPGQLPWPNRCSYPAHAVREALRDSGLAKKDEKDLAYWTENLGKLLKERKPAQDDLSEPIDKAWEEAAKAQLLAPPGSPGSSKADGPLPPPPARPLTIDELRKADPITKESFALKAVFEEPFQSPKLHLLVEDKSVAASPFLCTFLGSSAQCAKLPAPIATGHSGFRLLGSTADEAAPLVFLGQGGSEGIFRSQGGELVDRVVSFDAYAAKGGFVALVAAGNNENGEFKMLTQEAPGMPMKSTLFEPEKMQPKLKRIYGGRMLWDQLLIQAYDQDDRLKLYAMPVTPNGASPLVEIGEIDRGGAISGCRTAETMVARIGVDGSMLTFLAGGRWSKPVAAGSTGGTFSCRGSEAVFTSEWGLSQARCTAAGCQDQNVERDVLYNKLADFAPRDKFFDAVELDGKLLVVWAGGQLAGLRMRLAPIEQIAQTKDIVLFDDRVQDGVLKDLSTMFEMRLYARDRAAYLLLSTLAGVHAIRIEADGTFAPAKINW
jgi:hypothetical protein